VLRHRVRGGGQRRRLGPRAEESARDLRALIYHETTGFRHPSIPYAIEQLELWGAANGVQFTADQTSDRFTNGGPARYDVVVFLSTVGGVHGDAPLLTDAEWSAFQRYIRRGGGYAGIHAASDCCDESAWYGELLGKRSWYTGLGHDANIFAAHDSMRMIIEGIRWAGGRRGLQGCRNEGGD
jgi:type 1 glutamine amidotransferase